MNPMVSVIIPVYNRARKIMGAVKSIQQQTYTNFEIVVVDDSSTDNTVAVVEEIAKQDVRVRLVSQRPNKGAQAARNVGIHASRGEWIAFLDSDDEWLPRSLELRLGVATKENVLVVHSDCQMIEPDGSMRQYHLAAVSGEVYKKLLQGEGPMFQGLLVSKKALERINYLDESIVAFQEWDTSIRLAKYYRFGFVAEPTFIYDCRGTDTISKQIRRGGVGYEQIIKKHGSAMFWSIGPSYLAHHYEIIAGWYERGSDLESAGRCKKIARYFKLFNPSIILRKLTTIFKIKEEAR